MGHFSLRVNALPLEAVTRGCLGEGVAGKAYLRSGLWLTRSELAEKADERGGIDACLQTELGEVIARYHRRAATRATPLGIWSGVGVGRFDDATRTALAPQETWKVSLRPDLVWWEFASRRHEQEWLEPETVLTANPLAYVRGNRLILPCSIRTDDPKDLRDGADLATGDKKSVSYNLSIRATPPVRFVLERCEDSRGFSVLAGALVDEGGCASVEVAEKLIRQLLELGFVMTPFHGNVGRDQIWPISETELRRKAPQIAHFTHEIEAAVSAHSAERPGLLADLSARLAAVEPVSQPLRANLIVSNSDFALPHAVAEECSKVAALLTWCGALAASDTGRGLGHYHQEYIERYGMQTAVPLSTLLDPHLGLGAPPGYRHPPEARKRQSDGQDRPAANRIEVFLERAVLLALSEGRREVRLHEEQLAELGRHSGERAFYKGPPTMEICAELVVFGPDALAKGDFQLVLSPVVGSDSIGKLSGRFLSDLPEWFEVGLRDAALRVSSRPGAPIYAQVMHRMALARLNNIVAAPRLWPVVLRSDGAPREADEQTLTVKDLLVAADEGGLHLRCRRSGREVIATTAHVLNVDLLPNALRFALEVSAARSGALFLPKLARSENFPFVPRLIYKRTVLAPARWRIWSETQLGDGRETLDNETILRWRKTAGLPRYVYSGTYDLRLLYDLENADERAELARMLRRDGVLEVTEFIGSFDDRPFRSLQGAHNAEIVVPLMRSSPTDCPTVPLRPVRVEPLIAADACWKYLQLYADSERFDDLLTQEIAPLIRACLSDGLCEQWFFLRYSVPAPHLRLRLRASGSPEASEIGQRLHEFAHRMLETGQIADFAFLPYRPEYSRYGGEAAVALAEAVFWRDSEYVLAMLTDSTFSRMPKSSRAALGLIDALPAIAPDLAPDAFFGALIDRRAFNDSLRDHAVKLVSRDPEAGGLRDLRRSAFSAYSRHIQAPEWDFDRAERLAMVRSLFHMHCNRLMGTQKDERAANALARRIQGWLRHASGL